jgi:hypothetical protein
LVLLALPIRLIEISQPFVDDWSWRETDVAMIARNFFIGGFNIFYPRVDWAGPYPGYVGIEFPLVPFIASLLYIPFGVNDWVGRSVSAFFFVLSVPFLYLLVKEQSDRTSALTASVVYVLIPLNIFASRSFMSDMASLSLSIVAVYLFSRWLEEAADLRLFLVTVAASALSILVKLPAICVGLVFLYMGWRRYGRAFVLCRGLWIFGALTLVFPFAWYFHARQIAAGYPPYHLAGDGVLQLTSPDRYADIASRIVTTELTPLVAGAMLIGVLVPTHGRLDKLFHWWLASLLPLFVLAGAGHWLHPWYQLPIVPVAAAFAGRAATAGLRALGRLSHSRVVAGTAAVGSLCLLGYLSYLYVKPLYNARYTSLWLVGRALNAMTPPQALVVIADAGHGAGLYYSGRQGWHFIHINTDDWRTIDTDSAQAVAELERRRVAGANYFAVPAHASRWFTREETFRKYLGAHYQRVVDTKDYMVFDLSVDRSQTGM